MKRTGVRFRSLTPDDNAEEVIGGRSEKVVAFEFRNEGTDANMVVKKDGQGFTLTPGQEKAFALDGKQYFEESLLVMWEDDGASPVKKGVLTEMYVKS